MTANLNDPFPHAQAFTNFGSPITLAPQARSLLLSNFSASAASITVTTVGGETITIALGTPTVAQPPILLPIQVAVINSATAIGTVTALYH